MKKLLVTLIALVGVGVAGLAFADGLGTGIATVGSPHNFADDQCGGVPCTGSQIELGGPGVGWNEREEICRVCHVPHDHANGAQYWLNGLLWNHQVSTYGGIYTPYDSGSMDATVGDPSGPSLLCLGCHDGTTAVDTFDKYAGGANFIVGYDPGFQVPNTGGGAGDLSGTHPISMSYYDDLVGLNPDTDNMGTSGTIADVLFGTSPTGTVECSSCHDLHDQQAVAATHLLRVGNTAATGTPSGLCLTCHIK